MFRKLILLLTVILSAVCNTFAQNYLTFTVQDPTCRIMLDYSNCSSSPVYRPTVQYRVGGSSSWLTMSPNTWYNFSQGTKIEFRGNNPHGFSYNGYMSPSNLEVEPEKCYTKFDIQGKVAASGSVMSLIDNMGTSTTIPNHDCFLNLFSNCDITTPPALPATSLQKACYASMFAGCKYLTTAPELPAEGVSEASYCAMFQACSSLVYPPMMNAKYLSDDCFSYMFSNCTSLISAPALSAVYFDKNCYRSMFYGCSNLTKATIETYHMNAYEKSMVDMFDGCSSLKEIHINFSEFDGDFTGWTSGVASNGEFYCPKSMGDNQEFGSNRIPNGWLVNPSKVEGISGNVIVSVPKTSQTVIANTTKISQNEAVEIKAPRGYKISSLTVKGKWEDPEVTDDGYGTYTYHQPYGGVAGITAVTSIVEYKIDYDCNIIH